MWLFKKSSKQYKTKIIERIEYRSIEQKDFDQKVKQFEKTLTTAQAKLDYDRRKFEQDRDKLYADEREKLDQDKKNFQQEKHNLINEAKQQLLDTSKKTYEKLLATEFDTLITDQERENFAEMIKHDPYIDLDKLEVPYYNIRKALRRAHAY